MPYFGGAWRLLIEFPEAYPSKPPSIFFVTPVLHLNVNAQVICCVAAEEGQVARFAMLLRRREQRGFLCEIFLRCRC